MFIYNNVFIHIKIWFNGEWFLDWEMQRYTDEYARTSLHISVVCTSAEVRCSQFEATRWLATAADWDQPPPACFENFSMNVRKHEMFNRTLQAAMGLLDGVEKWAIWRQHGHVESIFQLRWNNDVEMWPRAVEDDEDFFINRYTWSQDDQTHWWKLGRWRAWPFFVQ